MASWDGDRDGGGYSGRTCWDLRPTGQRSQDQDAIVKAFCVWKLLGSGRGSGRCALQGSRGMLPSSSCPAPRPQAEQVRGGWSLGWIWGLRPVPGDTHTLPANTPHPQARTQCPQGSQGSHVSHEAVLFKGLHLSEPLPAPRLASVLPAWTPGACLSSGCFTDIMSPFLPGIVVGLGHSRDQNRHGPRPDSEHRNM
jgi:hypothetical protein